MVKGDRIVGIAPSHEYDFAVPAAPLKKAASKDRDLYVDGKETYPMKIYHIELPDNIGGLKFELHGYSKPLTLNQFRGKTVTVIATFASGDSKERERHFDFLNRELRKAYPDFREHFFFNFLNYKPHLEDMWLSWAPEFTIRKAFNDKAKPKLEVRYAQCVEDIKTEYLKYEGAKPLPPDSELPLVASIVNDIKGSKIKALGADPSDRDNMYIILLSKDFKSAVIIVSPIIKAYFVRRDASPVQDLVRRVISERKKLELAK